MSLISASILGVIGVLCIVLGLAALFRNIEPYESEPTRKEHTDE